MKLYFSEIGSGLPVIFLHGFPFDHQLWDQLIPHLSDAFRYILPDLRGFGKSQTENSDYLMSEMAKDVIQLMDDLRLQNAILVGHSMGGYLALEIMHQLQDRIRGLCLVASHIYNDTPDIKANRLNMIKKLDSTSPLSVLGKMPDKLSTNPTVQDYCRKAIENADAAGIKGALNAMANRSSYESLWERSTTPKLLIVGNNDQFISPQIREEVVNAGKDVMYKVIENAGHMLMRERPLETAAELEGFFRQISRE
jgi:3-oxoadipate enol-lactonase